MAEFQSIAQPAGRRRRRFVLDKEIGHGTFGVVYRVREPGNCNQLYALKAVRVDRIWVSADDHGGSSLQVPETDAEWAERVEGLKVDLADEMELLSRLRHPNIIEFKDTVNVRISSKATVSASPLSSYPAMLTDLCDGTLWDLDAVHINDPVSPRYRWTMFRQMISALVYLHDMGLIHQDIKPKNIFYKVNPQCRIRRNARYGAHMYPSRTRYTFVLGDFGMCATAAAAQGSNPGTRTYMAPEHKAASPCYASDLYSLYVTILVSHNVDGLGTRLVDQPYNVIRSMIRTAMQNTRTGSLNLGAWEFMGRSNPVLRGTARIVQDKIWEFVDFDKMGLW